MFLCTFADIDECTAGTDDCDDNAKCTNSEGSFECECMPPYCVNTGNARRGECLVNGKTLRSPNSVTVYAAVYIQSVLFSLLSYGESLFLISIHVTPIVTDIGIFSKLVPLSLIFILILQFICQFIMPEVYFIFCVN